MTTKIRKSRKDLHKIERNLNVDNCKPYTTSKILIKLQEELELNCLVSKELFDANKYWIEKFKMFPEIEFNLAVDDDFVEYFCVHKKQIENTAYPKKRRGRPLVPSIELRSKRISVYISDQDLEKLEKSAKRENMQLSDYLREIGLKRKIPPKPATLDLQAYSELSRSASNLNQIAKHLNSCPDAIIELDITIKALKDFRHSLIGVKTEGCNEI